MHGQNPLEKGTGSKYNELFLAYMHLFSEVGKNKKLFPKQCAACKRIYDSLSDYIGSTTHRRHTMEDCRSVMGRPFTMIYRQCGCGNTLVLNITEEIAAFLDSFWEMLTQTAQELNEPLKEVVADFVSQWELYVRDHDDSCR
jgi:hypothetical protein